MSSTEPPAGATPPPPVGSTPPPPAANYGTTPPPPPPSAYAGAPAAGAVSGVGAPGSLLDRFLARFIDGIIVGIVSVIINVVLGVVSDSWIVTNAISAVVTAVLYVGYFAYFESSRGQTIGKQIMKLKVEGPAGGNPTMEQAVRRNIWLGFGIAGVVPIVGALLGALAELAAVIMIAVGINSDPQRQHWFDKFAGGTRVTKIG